MQADLYIIINSTANIAAVALAVTFAGILTICITCEHYITSIKYYVPVCHFEKKLY